MHRRTFARLADLIEGRSQRPELRYKLEERRCLAAWPGAVGEQIAAATRPIKMQNGTLTVACKDPVWKSELRLMKSEIIRRLNSELGEAAIKGLRFSAAWVPGSAQAGGSRPSGLPDTPGDLERLTDAEKAQIAMTASRIDDERVSRSLLSAWETKRSLDKTRRALGWDECPTCGALKSPQTAACPVCESHKG